MGAERDSRTLRRLPSQDWVRVRDQSENLRRHRNARRENLNHCSQYVVKCAGEGRGDRGEEDGGGMVGSKK